MSSKMYLDNPYLREIEARVTSKIYENGKYYIKLNRTIFYPHLSDGQPGDKGTINGVNVLEVYEENFEIIHVVEENIQSDKVTLNIDWENRLDNMQQHTGQHLLSAAFYKLYNGETLGFHIGHDSGYIDINLPKLSEDEAERVELYVNRIIYSNFDIKSYYIEEGISDNISIEDGSNGNSNIRIVEIDNIDFSPCAGTHLRTTGELGLLKICNWKKDKDIIRLEFLCGNRALDDYAKKDKILKDISSLLDLEESNIFESIKDLYNIKNELEKENLDLRSQLASNEG